MLRQHRNVRVPDALFISVYPKDYINKMRKRDPELEKGYGHFVRTLNVETKGGLQKLELESGEPVVSNENYLDISGKGELPELQDSLRAIDQGIADVEAGRTKPANQFFADVDG